MNEEVMRFNSLLREYEEVYRDIARRYAMPELSLWVLYVLCRKADCTQKDIADQIMRSKQSINSAIKYLVSKGFVTLDAAEGNRKEKHIRLTDAGHALAKKTAWLVVEAEDRAFKSLGDEGRRQFLSLFDALVSALKGGSEI